jgi:hypothetical protein
MVRLLSKLQPDTATSVGILTAVGVYLVYQNSLPNLADVRLAPANDNTVEKSRKAAAWKSAGLITVVFLVARDLNSYIISGAALVGIDYMYKHSNAVNGTTGKLDTSTGGGSPVAQYPMASYETTDGG